MITANGTLDLGMLAPGAWEERRTADRELIGRLLPDSLGALHDVVVARAEEVGARALILSGSTARGSRTGISDVDYHLVGGKIATRDLSAELDLHVLSPEQLRSEVLEGDDFIQWSLRFGLVVFDDGTLFDALRLMAERRPWPDVARKREHAAKSLEFALRVVETGDLDGALVQVRTGLSLAARAFLLSRGEFPMSRGELPSQLFLAGAAAAARALEACIHGEPTLETLRGAISQGDKLLAQPTGSAARAVPCSQRAVQRP